MTHAGTPPAPLEIRQHAGVTEVYLPSTPVAPVAGTRYRLTVEGSTDFKTWGPPIELPASDDPGAPFKLSVGGKPTGFYRLQSEVLDAGGPADGAALFGYNRVFDDELRKVGYPAVADFAARFTPANQYLAQVAFDPTSARYWKELNTDPAVFNAGLPANSPDRRLHDFRLNTNEFLKFQTNGFVVSERLGSYSFADVYYAVFADDFPVFISADSALHAWHWSYQAMLSELEETQLTQAFQSMLDLQAGQVAAVAAVVGNGPLHDSVLDADYFLTVARSLLSGTTAASALGQDARVTDTLAAVAARQYREQHPLWGKARAFDFSQFTVRGHYTRTVALSRYFQAFLWTALADLRVAGTDATTREVGTAIVLHELYSRGNAAGPWQTMDELLGVFVGRTDSLTFRELGPLRTAAGLTLTTANTPGRLALFQADLLAGNYGVQTYASAAYATPHGPAQTQLPRVFTVTGQRFIPDGWATAQVTFDRIRWNEELPDGKSFFGKVVRRMPTGLDVAFGVFGNAQITPEITAGIVQTGLPYQHNLAAVQATFDRQDPSAWEDSIYSRWLYSLRMLSAPTTDPRFPQAMRTRAWAHKTVNTQLASWTQLRHDTVLYAAQPYTGIILCEYPAGYIEPRVEFWEAMRGMAQSTANVLSKFNVGGTITVQPNPEKSPVTVNLFERKVARITHCRNFAAQMAVLRELARKELAATPFTDTETLFVRSTMNSQDHGYFGKTYDGWFPKLFYEDYGQGLGNYDYNASDVGDALVTDVHSAPPDQTGFAGSVLHEAVGNVDLLLIAVDSGPDRMVYAGPTLSHYEFIQPGLTRLNDSNWQTRLNTAPKPPRPAWTQDYLVPK
jgi:hypothetical protein